MNRLSSVVIDNFRSHIQQSVKLTTELNREHGFCISGSAFDYSASGIFQGRSKSIETPEIPEEPDVFIWVHTHPKNTNARFSHPDLQTLCSNFFVTKEIDRDKFNFSRGMAVVMQGGKYTTVKTMKVTKQWLQLSESKRSDILQDMKSGIYGTNPGITDRLVDICYDYVDIETYSLDF